MRFDALLSGYVDIVRLSCLEACGWRQIGVTGSGVRVTDRNGRAGRAVINSGISSTCVGLSSSSVNNAAVLGCAEHVEHCGRPAFPLWPSPHRFSSFSQVLTRRYPRDSFDPSMYIYSLLTTLEHCVPTRAQVKDCTPLVNLELVSVRATAPENLLLIFLEKIVLRRVAKLAPGSDAGVEAERLLNTVDTRAKGAAEAAAALAGSSATPPCDDSSRFPNKAYVALCQRALHSARGSVSWEEGSAEGEIGAEGSRDDESRFQLVDLVNLAFAVDEIGGEATWRWVLDALEDEKKGTGGEGEDDEKGPEDDDPDREGAVHLLKAYLPAETSNEELDCEAGAPGRAGTPSMVGGTAGSKLEKIAALLLEYKERCDEAGSVFSALVFVSTRDLATATPGMLEAVPTLQPFVKAQHIVGLSEMTLSEQRAALESFKTGPANVLVSTSVCGEGIEVPACALVVCASLPSSGTELVQLRGRIRCEENSR